MKKSYGHIFVFKVVKTQDPDNHKCSSYSNGLNAQRSLSLSNSNGFGRNIIIFGTDMSPSVHLDNNKKLVKARFFVKVQ